MYLLDIGKCWSNPCQNGGSCTDVINGYSCSCAAGYSGLHCETGQSFRSSFSDQVHRLNNASCFPTYVFFLQLLEVCPSNPCQNGGTCVRTRSSADTAGYTCDCPQGYSELHCEVGKLLIKLPRIRKLDPGSGGMLASRSVNSRFFIDRCQIRTTFCLNSCIKCINSTKFWRIFAQI